MPQKTFSVTKGGIIKMRLKITRLSHHRSVVSLVSALAVMVIQPLAALAVTAPTITPGTGVQSAPVSTVTITATPGDTIHFTTTGAVPTSSSPVYSAPITIGDTAVIKAIARNGGVDSLVSESYVQSDSNTLPVPRTGLKIWYKSDFGPLTSSGTSVDTWVDMSGAASRNDATQATSGNRPTLVSNAINGEPAVSFDGSNDYMSLASGLTDLTAGVSIFAVVKPVGTGTATLVTSGNSGPADMTSLQTINTQAKFNSYNSTTASNITTPSSSVVVGKYQLIDVVHDGSASADLSVKSISRVVGTVQNLTNTSRSQNYLGTDGSISTYFDGQIAEILVYGRGVTVSEAADIRAYLTNRYQLLTATATPDPILSAGTSTLEHPIGIGIASNDDAEVWITLDGTTPSAGGGTSVQYTGPVWISHTRTLKAIAVAKGVSSNVVTATYTLDATRYPAPDSMDTRPLNINLQLPTTAIPD
ncbi:MAG: chitobiase/beta-hexosaminidase C-terminal domain-containing protein [Candidatus Obscuribacter sp.]|nr:chitobiase/beta-hexosaminidase C-terminal domain-containing protein [Candidatus Obscuribacter sp.]